ncbi:MAG: 30S ribosomal protein S4 [Candidatus Diapherotrites archaeon]|nr:30S ribosomal protein S4 [Candidatus Diapherotrites archaeon]
MGGTKKLRSTYSRPRRPWDKQRITEENQIKRGYGLKNKKEIWKAKDYLNKVRSTARVLLAQASDEREFREKELLESLKRRNILKSEGTLDDVLSLKVEDVLERRLQTQIWKTGMASTPQQARQFLVHGHILLNDRKVTRPSQLLFKGEESQLKFKGNPLFLAKPKEMPKKEAQMPKAEEILEEEVKQDG